MDARPGAAARTWSEAAADLWARIGGPTDADDVTRTGTSTGLAAVLPVEALAMASVSAAGRAAAAWSGVPASEVVVDAARVGSSFRADQLIRIAGVTPSRFAPLSGFLAAADGWVRTHANYRHHRARLLAALGIEDRDDTGGDVRERLAAAIAERPAREIEEAVTAHDGIAAAVRTRREWLAEPAGAAVAGESLVDVIRRDPHGRRGPLQRSMRRNHPRRARVLDMTRVLAGPVATRTLALVGADVLRVDPPNLPELAAQHVDTGIGKRTTVLDARSPEFRTLLEDADILVTGYRPDGVTRLGLDPAALLAEHPDLVVVRLDAWGWSGPWAGRRGFDSIVQAACGIADLTGHDGAPGALPAQALDYATGYLAAATALLGLAERPETGGSVRDLALARTADWLFATGSMPDPPTSSAPVDDAPALRQPLGDDEVAPPALILPAHSGLWSEPAHPIGSDPPRWNP